MGLPFLRSARRLLPAPGPAHGWLLAFCFVGFGFLLMRAGTKELPMQRVAITLVPSDAAHLACAWSGKIGGASCEYDAAGDQDPASSSTHLIPVMTLDRELLLVAGLFQTAAVATKLAEPGVVAEDKRLTVQCTVKTASKPRDVRTRFRRDAAWSAPERARGIEVVGCVVP